ADHPMLQAREVHRTGYIVVTSDRGLAGAYNSNVLKKLLQIIRTKHKSADEYMIIVVGRVGYDFCRKMDMPVVKRIIGLDDQPSFADIKDLASETEEMFSNGDIDELTIIYNHYVSSIVQKVNEKQLITLTDPHKAEDGR